MGPLQEPKSEQPSRQIGNTSEERSPREPSSTTALHLHKSPEVLHQAHEDVVRRSTEPIADPPAVEAALPVPFTKEEAERYAAKSTGDSRSSPSTSYEDCAKIGGHGGPDGSRMYYPSG